VSEDLKEKCLNEIRKLDLEGLKKVYDGIEGLDFDEKKDRDEMIEELFEFFEAMINSFYGGK